MPIPKKYDYRGETYPKLIKPERGIRIIDQGPLGKGNRFLAGVWDAKKPMPKGRLGGYDWESFDTLPAADADAKTRKAGFISDTKRAGAVTISDSREAFEAYLSGKGDSAAHIAEYKTLLDEMIAAGIDNLKDDNLAMRAIHYLDCRVSLKSQPRKEEVLRRRHHHGTDGTPRPISDGQRAKLVRMMRHLGNWARRSKKVLSNPFEMVPVPTLAKKLPPVYSIEDCRKLVADSVVRDIHNLLYAVLAYTGLREQEAAWLRWCDIRWAAKLIVVELVDGKAVKRNKERLVVLFDELAEMLAPINKGDDSFIFPASVREVSHKTHWERFYALLEKLKITHQPRLIHSLRATHGCLAVACGALEATQLQEHLGHESLSTSQGYVRAALLFRVETAGWNKQLRLRTAPPARCNQGATGAPQKTMAGSDEPPPEDDIRGEFFVVLNDNSTVFTEVLAGKTAHCKSVHPGSIPGGASDSVNLDPDSELEDPPPCT